MKTFRSRYARRVLVPVMAVSVLSACHHWAVHEMAPAQLVTEKEPDRVRLTMLDGGAIEITDPWLSGGEIAGHPTGVDAFGSRRVISSATLRVPIDSVAYAETRKADIVAMIALIAPVVGLIVFTIVCSPEGACCISVSGQCS